MILKHTDCLMDYGCEALGKTYKEIRVCELGDQKMIKGNPIRTCKALLMNRGVIEHVSIDWNGKHGALKMDLAEPITKWKNYFDMVTNYGTTEHVLGGQYEAFQNIHNFTKVGGAMIHCIPMVGYFKRHCRYHYYPDFATVLAEENGYDCYFNDKINVHRTRDEFLLSAVLVKKNNDDFMTQADFNNMGKIKGLEV